MRVCARVGGGGGGETTVLGRQKDQFPPRHPGAFGCHPEGALGAWVSPTRTQRRAVFAVGSSLASERERHTGGATAWVCRPNKAGRQQPWPPCVCPPAPSRPLQTPRARPRPPPARRLARGAGGGRGAPTGSPGPGDPGLS